MMRALVLAAAFCLPAAMAEEWPQWRGPNRDGVWRETGIVERFSSPDIALKWKVPISSGYSGPTVAGGRVYVMDRVAKPVELERVHCSPVCGRGAGAEDDSLCAEFS